MKAKFIRSYRSKNGNTVFVYGVAGTKDQIDAFKEIQGDQLRESDEGVPLWFTTRFIGNTGTLVVTSNNKIVPDMSAYEKANSLAEQFGGNLGQELAKQAAAELLGTPAAVVNTVPANAGSIDGF